MRASSRREPWAVVAVAALSLAFLVRVAGQAIQRWFPQEFIPPFESWQGSGISYPALLAGQIVILWGWHQHRCARIPNAR